MTARQSNYSVQVDQITETEWSNLLPRFDDASVYQSWAYGAVSWGPRNLSHLTLKRGTEVVGMAQFRIVRVPLLSSGIAYLRWGPLYRLHDAEKSEDVLPMLLEAITNEYVRRRRLMIRIVPNVFQGEPEAQAFENAIAKAGFNASAQSSPYRTLRVDLTPPLDQMRKRLDQKWRNQLNSSERQGLRVIAGTSDELFERFLGIYRELLTRKRFRTSVDAGEFGTMQRALPPHLKMPILLCEKDGQLTAGLVASAAGDTGIYLLGATSTEGMKYKGSYLLQWRMMQLLKEHGCRWYDLGGINPDHNPGVYHFKAGMGGTEVRQCGRAELSGSLCSSLCVSAAENLKNTITCLKAAFRSGKSTA